MTPEAAPGLGERATDKVCGRCHAAYRGEEWSQLAPQGFIGGVRVRAFVEAWPETAGIELRSCRGCGATLARTMGSHRATTDLPPGSSNPPAIVARTPVSGAR